MIVNNYKEIQFHIENNREFIDNVTASLEEIILQGGEMPKFISFVRSYKMTEEHNGIGFMSQRDVSELTTLSRTTLWRLVRDQVFPQPFRISKGRIVWWRKEVFAWMADLPRT